MPSVATTPRRMETFARTLDRAVTSKIVPRPHIDQIRCAFMATDALGRSWTIDPEFQRWGHLEGELWMVGDPPPQLFIDAELRASLEAVEAMTARAIVRGDAPLGPSTPWFRMPFASAESHGVPASTPSPEPDTAPHRIVEPAPMVSVMSPSGHEDSVAEPAPTMSVIPSEVAAEQDPVIEPAPIVSVMSPEMSAPAEPMAIASVETAPAPEPVALPTVMATSDSSMVDEPAPWVASHVVMPAPAPIEVTPPPSLQHSIPEAHLRFARPDIAPVSGDAATRASALMVAPAATAAPERIPTPAATAASERIPTPAEPPASVRHRAASHDLERWVPTSIAPRLTADYPEANDDRAHVFLCGLLAALFLALGVWKGDSRGYAVALLFALVAAALLVLNLAQRRHD